MFHPKRILKRDAEFVRMNIFLSKEQLKVQFTVPDFVLNTQRQIAKDFELSGCEFDNKFKTTALEYHQLLLTVEDKLLEIMRLGETQLLQLLYQIDIPQQNFLQIVQEEDLSSQLAEMIVRREAYKIYLRSKF